jgi:predicted XRE-type DNA-binding protein
LKLSLIKQADFNNLQLDVYQNSYDELFMTREQIGQALEYSSPMIAIAKIHKKNSDRLDPLSVLTKLVNTHDGKTYNSYVYSTRGIFEICRYSRQPKADAFMDKVWDIMEGIYKGEIALVKRQNAAGITLLSPSQNRVYELLNELAGETKKVQISFNQLAKLLGVSQPSVSAIIHRMERKGLLTVEHYVDPVLRVTYPNTYYINKETAR